MKTGRSLVDLATEIDKQAKSKRDFKADTGVLTLHTNGDSYLTVGSVGQFAVNPVAHQQVAERLKIPKGYYDRMREEAPALLDYNVNHWFQKTRETRLIRVLDNRIRAFLSDRYRPLDNADMAEVALTAIRQFDCRVESCELTETHLYIKAVTERIQGRVKGGIVQAGIVVSNSEVGFGAVKVEPMVWILACLNGMITADRSMKKYHIGKGGNGDLDGASEFFLDETRLADDKAFWMKARDVIMGSFNRDVFDRTMGKMEGASQVRIDKPVEVVEMTAKKFNLTDGAKEGILNHLIKGGDVSQYGLMNAVTRYSQDVESYEEATDLERLGGLVLELPRSNFTVN